MKGFFWVCDLCNELYNIAMNPIIVIAEIRKHILLEGEKEKREKGQGTPAWNTINQSPDVGNGMTPASRRAVVVVMTRGMGGCV